MISFSIILLLLKISDGFGNGSIIGTNFTVANINYTMPNYTLPNYTWPNINYTAPNYTWPNTNYTLPNYTMPANNYTWPNLNYSFPNYTWPFNNYTWPNVNFTWPNYTWPNINFTWPNYTWPNVNFTWPNFTWPNYTWPIKNYSWPSINYTFPNYTWPSFNWTWPDVNVSINSSRTIPPPSCNGIVLNAVFLFVAQPVDVCTVDTSAYSNTSQMYTCSDQGTISLKKYFTTDCTGPAETYSNYCDNYPYGCGQSCNVDACDYFIEREYANTTGCDKDLPTGADVTYEETAIILDYCSYAWTGSVIYRNNGSYIFIEAYNTTDCSDDPFVSPYQQIGDSCKVDAQSGIVTATQIRTSTPATTSVHDAATPKPVDNATNNTMDNTDDNDGPFNNGKSMISFTVSLFSIAATLVFLQ